MEINFKNVFISLSKFVLGNVFKFIILLFLWFFTLVFFIDVDIESSKAIISAFVFINVNFDVN